MTRISLFPLEAAILRPDLFLAHSVFDQNDEIDKMGNLECLKIEIQTRIFRRRPRI